MFTRIRNLRVRKREKSRRTQDLYRTVTSARNYRNSLQKDLETAKKGGVRKQSRIQGFESLGTSRSYSELFSALSKSCLEMENSDCNEMETICTELYDKFCLDSSERGETGRQHAKSVLNQLKLYRTRNVLNPNNCIEACVSSFFNFIFNLITSS